MNCLLDGNPVLPGDLLFNVYVLNQYHTLGNPNILTCLGSLTLMTVLSSELFDWTSPLSPLHKNFIMVLSSRGSIGYVSKFYIERV